MEDIKKWLQENSLDATFIKDNIFEIKDFGKFLVISEKDETFFQNEESLILSLSDEEIDLIDEIEYFAYKFGSFWFYQHKDDEDFKLNFLRYIGKSSVEPFDVPFLGLHGRFELCNGSRDYADWIKKIKFLGYSSLGICEYQTLAGSYYFQKICDKEGIKAIIGRTSKVKSESGATYNVKCYVKNKQGWKDLLNIHRIEIIKRDADGQYITEEELSALSENIFIVICHETDLNLVNVNTFKKLYFQFNPVQYKFDNKDREHLLNLKQYLDHYFHIIEPVIIQDAFYIDKGDHVIKPILNKIINKTSQFFSEDEYLKDFESVILSIVPLFKDGDDRLGSLIDRSIENLTKIHNECNFQIKREDRHLPKYKMNEDEKLLYSDNEEMFFSLIEKGFKLKVAGQVEDENIYVERLQKEIEVLQEGNVIDYFLIMYDIYNYVEDNCGIVACGRGSAAGSLVSYLLNIVQIDPIQYGLLFERFLSKARLLGGSLPDIDADIPSFFRQNVIEYIINKYGRDQVACIGTSQNFKLKSSLKDLLKLKGVDFKTTTIITGLFDKEYDHLSIEGIFKLAMKKPEIKNIIKKYPEIIYEIYLCIFQARSFGIHAAGVIIAPDKDRDGNLTTIHDYASCRFSGDMYVTEWEKDAVEEIGLLKEDILGLTQLDKIIRMNELIKANKKEYLPFSKINFEDDKIMNLFRHAITEDIFQFNTDIQKSYLLRLQPEGVNHLIAANAINRPGAMESNYHNKYISIKNGEEEVIIPPLLENELSETYGMYLFQENAMISFQMITDCTLEESDNFRKVISKAKPGKRNPDIEKYEEIFKKAYMDKINDEKVVNTIWDQIIALALYSFNKSHAASYALTGYWAAYYKAYFPVEFYTTSLELSNDDTLPRLINEIQSQQLVTLSHPDINKSGTKYAIDYQNNSIYWSLISIKQAGEKAVSTLMEERNVNGPYFSFEEFLDRAKGFKVNKRIITNFILCGCFDEIEKINEEKDRLRLLTEYYKLLKEEIPAEIKYHNDIDKNHFWILMQKTLCGLGNISFEGIYRSQKIKHWLTVPYMDSYIMQDFESIGKNVVVGGLLETIKEIVTRKGETMAIMKLNCNGQIINVTCWPETFGPNKETLYSSMFQPIMLSGVVTKDFKRPMNVIITNSYTQIIKS